MMKLIFKKGPRLSKWQSNTLLSAGDSEYQPVPKYATDQNSEWRENTADFIFLNITS